MNYLKNNTRFWYTLTMPFIYSGIIPFIILDVFLEVYHRLCFPVYRLPYIKRREYIRIDRHRLSYLNALQKLNCMYCGYGNGLLRYASEIALRTEQFWCGIKHDTDPGRIFYAPELHDTYLPYGNRLVYKDFEKKGKALHKKKKKK